jgi:hypothetical protein
MQLDGNRVRRVDAALGGVPLDERVSALVVSLVTRRTEGVRAIVSLFGLISAIGSFLRVEERILLAELARDVADRLEYEKDTGENYV